MENFYEELIKSDELNQKKRKIYEVEEVEGVEVEGKVEEEEKNEEEKEMNENNHKVEEKVSQQTQKKEVNVQDALQTLSRHILNEKKVIKAISLLIDLLKAKLSDDNSQHFFNILELFFNSLPLELPKSYPSEESIILLISQYCENKFYFTPQQQFEIQSWYIQTYIVKELKKSDDSFHFNKLCQFMQVEFQVNLFEKKINLEDEINEGNEGNEQKHEIQQNENDPFYFVDKVKRHRLEVILLCLKICYQVYVRSRWSKQPVESLYLTVSQWKLSIPFEDIREKLDEINTKLIQYQRKLISGGVSDIKTIRTYNSTAHPLKTKKVGVLR